MKTSKLFTLCLLGTGTFFSACTKDEVIEQVEAAPSDATIVVDARVGNEDFALNKNFTVNGNTNNFEKLRYWISNVVLTNDKGVKYEVPNSYFLMEEVGELDLTGTISDNNMIYPAKKREEIKLEKIPSGTYNSITFSIGVDPVRNSNLSLQAGELTIANGMSNISWMWHTSYIFSSISGKASTGAGEPGKFLAETGLNENYKTVTIPLSSPLAVATGTSPALVINLDIMKVLDGVDVISTPAIDARKPELMSAIATNFSQKAFSFGSIE